MLSQLRPYFFRLALPLAASAAVAACSSAPPPKLQQEMFDTGASPFSRNFRASSADACEAARRALLSQGYLTTASNRADTIDASKDFQPSSDKHIGVEFHVVCTPGEDADNSSIVYANAVQSGYTLKKSDTSASVGLSILGSLSLPIRSNSDAMVKVSSETIQSGAFYDRFFDYVDQYLRTVVKAAPVPATPLIKSSEIPASPAVAPASPATQADAPSTGGIASQPAAAQPH